MFGVSLTTNEAIGVTYNGLLSLQHRGQEGAGIAVVHDHHIRCHKGVGLVNEVFSHQKLDALPAGRIALGHTRYSTTGHTSVENTGPFVTEYLTGRVAVAHNGNITNAKDIRENLQQHGLRFGATSDSEVVSSLIAYHITKAQDTVAGIIEAAHSLQGAYSLVIASSENKLVALRDANGFRPLCIGKNETGYAVASESCALDACGFAYLRDVQPGEVIVIEDGEIVHEAIELTKCANACDDGGLCLFEYVYFARPDSVIDGLNVYKARQNMGMALAAEHPVEADIVCGVPDSGLVAANGFSAKSGIPLVSGFVKNRYIGRSFIYPTQTQRDSAVRLKLNPLSAVIAGKRIVLVDDSIVRGTTSERIIGSLKSAGAKEVHMRVSSPPFLHTCHYGTDIGSEDNLIANRMSLDEIRRKIGADSLGYISIEGLREACGECRLPLCTACFTGHRGGSCDKGSHVSKGVLEEKDAPI